MSRVREQYEQACRYLAGGVSSSTRVNKALGHAMLFDRAEGCRLWDLVIALLRRCWARGCLSFRGIMGRIRSIGRSGGM